MEITIGANHRDQLARQQHILEWLQQERARMEAEYAHVQASTERVQQQLLGFLVQVYGIDPAQPVTINTERGVLVVPDPAEPSEQPTQEGTNRERCSKRATSPS